MAIRIKSRSGESTEQMLRRFKKLCEKEGLTKDIKRKEFYEKPSERARRDMRKAIARRMREQGLFTPKPGSRGAAAGAGKEEKERN
jgi:small subunit ribosomal protein S21